MFSKCYEVENYSVKVSVSVSVIFLAVVYPRVLQSLWELLLRMILDTVAENRGVQVEFYTRFQYTAEVSADE